MGVGWCRTAKENWSNRMSDSGSGATFAFTMTFPANSVGEGSAVAVGAIGSNNRSPNTACK